MVIGGINRQNNLVFPVEITTISGPTSLNKTIAQPNTWGTVPLGDDLPQGNYRIKIKDSACFEEEYDLVTQSYFKSIEIRDLTYSPVSNMCNRYKIKGLVDIKVVGNELTGTGDLEIAYPSKTGGIGYFSGPTGLNSRTLHLNDFKLKKTEIIPFYSDPIIPGTYQIALSKRSVSYRFVSEEDIWPNSQIATIAILPNFPTFDLANSRGVICEGETTADLHLVVNNSQDAVTFFIKKSSDLDYPATGQSSAVFPNLVAGTYSVKAVTSCYEVVQDFIIAPQQSFDIIVGDAEGCEGGQLNLYARGAAAFSSVAWTLPDGRVVPGNHLFLDNLTPAASGDYTVNIVTLSGCTIAETKNIQVHTTTTAADITAADHEIRLGDSVTLSATSNISNAVYTWYSDAALTAEIQPTVSPTATTTYYVTVKGDGVCENTAGAAKAVVVTVNSKATAADITATDYEICLGDSITLSASSNIANAVFTWYSDAALTAVIQPTVSPITTTTYYVTVKGDGVCENTANAAKAVTVTVNSKATAADIIADDYTICLGDSVSLVATTNIANAIFTWYSDAALTAVIQPTVSPIVTTTYYVTVQGDGVCENTANAAKAVVVTVNSQATAADITADDQIICRGNSITLSASSNISNAIFTWYSDAALTTEIQPTVSPTATTTYYVTVQGDGVCENTATAAKAVVVTVNSQATAADISADNQEICRGNSITLSATTNIANAIFTWYSDAALTRVIQPTVSPTATTTYYVTVQGDGVCENTATAAKAVVVTVNSQATAADISAADQTICLGDSITLSASSNINNPVFTWYSDAALTRVIQPTVSPTATTTYYVTVQGDGVCENTANASKAVVVTVNSNATAADITVTDYEICFGSEITLRASSTIRNAVYTWYSDAALTTEIQPTVSPTVTTTYYVTVQGEGICEYAARFGKAVTVIVKRFTEPTTEKKVQEFCSNEPHTVSELQTNEPNVKWYDLAEGGVPLVDSTVLVSDKLYYASLVSSELGCESSARLAVKALLVGPHSTSIEGVQQVACVLEPTVYSTTAGMTDYIWRVQGGEILSQDAPLGSRIEVLWHEIGLGVVEVCYMDSAYCNSWVSASATVTIDSCSDLVIDKEVDDADPEIGQNVQFTITVTNTGLGAFKAVVVNEVLPSGYAFVRATAQSGSYSASTGLWQIPGLEALQHTTLQLVAQVLDQGDYLNIATIVHSNPMDMNPGNNSASATVEPLRIIVYNGVSLEKDGKNDFLFIKGLDKYPDNTVEIFNRWGKSVYKTEGYGLNNRVFEGYSNNSNSWNSNKHLPSGTYFYMLKYRNKTGKQISKSGYLQLQ